ncbi:NSP-interacting kinase 1-like protein [Tanacetum coccineum]
MVYTPQQNEVVERKHRHLLDTARDIKIHANLPNKFWGDFVLAATYLINKMPMKILDWKSPFEVLHGIIPSFEHLRTIGCLCYAAVTKPYKDKFKPRGNRCVMIGYPPGQKGYKLYDLHTKEIFYSRDVIFKEDVFPFNEIVSKPLMSSIPTYHSLVWEKDDFEFQLAEAETEEQHVEAETEEPHAKADTKEQPAELETEQQTEASVQQEPLVLNPRRSTKTEIGKVKKALDDKFTIKDLGLARYFLGIELCRTEHGTYLHQRKYVLDLQQDVGLTAGKSATFHLPQNLKLSLDKGSPLKAPDSYKRLVGILLYLSMTRTDISYAVQPLSQFISAPKEPQMQAALHLLRYLKGTISKGLFYHVQPQLKVADKEASHFQVPITLFCDNKAAQQIVVNSCFHERTKHLDIDCHFTRDKVQEGFLQTAYIPTNLELADIITKALGEKQHSFLSSKLGFTKVPT